MITFNIGSRAFEIEIERAGTVLYVEGTVRDGKGSRQFSPLTWSPANGFHSHSGHLEHGIALLARDREKIADYCIREWAGREAA